jgi:hypothetical protein
MVRQVTLMQDYLAQNLVTCRQKLAPFLDEGFIHQNRKIKKKGNDTQVVKTDAETEMTIKQIKYGIKKAMHEGKIYELENIIDHICLQESDSGESNKIY